MADTVTAQEKNAYPPKQEVYPPPYSTPQGVDPQGGYLQPQAYPPQQGAYPPPQGSYPHPQQRGYPPPGYSSPQRAPLPQQQQQTAVVVVQQPNAANVIFGNKPVLLPDGNTTVLRYRIGLLSWIVVGVVCLVTLELGVCFVGLIALLFDELKDVEHVHPVTGQTVGVYKRI